MSRVVGNVRKIEVSWIMCIDQGATALGRWRATKPRSSKDIISALELELSHRPRPQKIYSRPSSAASFLVLQYMYMGMLMSKQNTEKQCHMPNILVLPFQPARLSTPSILNLPTTLLPSEISFLNIPQNRVRNS